IAMPVFPALVALVPLEVPGETGGDLREPRIERTRAGRRGAGRACRRDPDLGDQAAIVVTLAPLDSGVLAECHVGESLLRSLAPRLVVLGRVDRGEAGTAGGA